MRPREITVQEACATVFEAKAWPRFLKGWMKGSMNPVLGCELSAVKENAVCFALLAKCLFWGVVSISCHVMHSLDSACSISCIVFAFAVR